MVAAGATGGGKGLPSTSAATVKKKPRTVRRSQTAEETALLKLRIHDLKDMLRSNQLDVKTTETDKSQLVKRLLTCLYPPTLEDIRNQRRKRLRRLPWDKLEPITSYTEPARSTVRKQARSTTERRGRPEPTPTARPNTQPVAAKVVISSTLPVQAPDFQNPQEATKWLHSLPGPSVEAYNAVIASHTKVGDTDEAVNTFQEMVMADLPNAPNINSYNLLIAAYVSSEKTNIAAQWFEDMISAGFQPDTATFQALCRITNPDESIRWFNTMRESKVRGDEQIYTNQITNCAKRSKPEEVIKTFLDMPDAGVAPNDKIYNAVINAYLVLDKMEKALVVFEDMVEAGMQPDATAYNTAIR
eukprot:SAG11_NODE_2121_length_3790_cov_3.824709_2_plen_358_part_00